jgi:aspartyl-tRNA(Asn)/glutamyl-tRNA(Gln) amidotransferase subunit A
MNDLAFASIRTLQDALTKGDISVSELALFFQKRFAQYDPVLGAALEVFEDPDLDLPRGPLYGIPGLIKDNICQKGRVASCASKILENYVAPYDATVVTRLRTAGAYSLGRGNLDEFAMGSSNETSAFKKTRNPWDIERVPGGSSGGPSVAVAAGLVPWSLGSETGGSIRLPAAFCNVVGLKPTYGLVSRYGLIALASSLDAIGCITRTVYDNALVLSAMVGQDPQDSTTLSSPVKDYTQQLTGRLKEGFTLGVINNALEAEGIDPEVSAALQEVLKEYERLGARIKRLTLPTMDHGAAVYVMLVRAEAASNLARFDGIRYGRRSPDAHTLTDVYTKSRSEGFGLEVKSRILIGNYILSVGHADAYYNSAKIVQSLMRQEFLNAFKEVDLLFAPVSAAPAFKFGAYVQSSIQMDLQDYFTAPANLAGIPALAVPCGFTKDKLPLAFQLIGPDLSEADLYQAAYAYEQRTQWHTMKPLGLE